MSHEDCSVFISGDFHFISKYVYTDFLMDQNYTIIFMHIGKNEVLAEDFEERLVGQLGQTHNREPEERVCYQGTLYILIKFFSALFGGT